MEQLENNDDTTINVIDENNDENYQVEHLDYSDLEQEQEQEVNAKSEESIETQKDHRYYVCPECNRFYTEKRSLKRHVLGAHPTKPDIWRHVKAFKSCMCIECHISFNDKLELKAHVLNQHPDKPHIWQLSDVNEGDPYKKQLGPTYTCDVCKNTYTEIRSLKRHVYHKHPEQPDVWKKAKIPSYIQRRRLSQHLHEQSYYCGECGNTYSHFRSLRRHAFKVHGIKITPASVSEQHEFIKDNDDDEEVDDELKTSFENDCKLCGKLFTEKRSLKRHFENMHPPSSPSLQHSRSGSRSKRRRYTCTVDTVHCNATFSNNDNFERHKYKVHGVKEYLCQRCGLRFRDIKNLMSHETYHLDVMPHKCTACESRFRLLANLKVHYRTHHEGHRYYCTVCGRAFLSNCTRKRHELIHTGVKQFKCDQCSAQFYTLKELKCHQRYHNDIRPHFCNICYKTFVTKTVLRVHMRSHTGERPFKCDVNQKECNKSFAEKAKLYRHIRNIHHINPFVIHHEYQHQPPNQK